MKKYFKLITIIFLYACQKSNLTLEPAQVVPSIGQTILPQGWVYTRPSINRGNAIPDVFFSDSIYGAFISKSGLFISTDGGSSWKKNDNPAFATNEFQFFNLFITPKRDLFLIGGQDKILRVRNDSVLSVTVKGLTNDVYFINDSVGYSTTKVGLYQTKNAGNSWSQVGKSINSFENGELNSLFFLNNGKGVISSTNKLSSNLVNDTIWNELPIQLPFIFSSYMISQNVYYLSTQTLIYKTIDGGKTFKSSYTLPSNVKGYVDLHFVDTNTGYFCAGNSIYKTTNAGDTWERILALRENSNEIIIELHFVSPTKGWACTSLGGILKFN